MPERGTGGVAGMAGSAPPHRKFCIPGDCSTQKCQKSALAEQAVSAGPDSGCWELIILAESSYPWMLQARAS